MKFTCILALALLVTVAIGCSGDRESSDVTDRSYQRASDSIEVALRESRIADAQQLARDALVDSPTDPDTLTDAARVTAAGRDRHEAAKLLAEAAVAAHFKPTSRVEIAVRALLEVGEVYPAIELLSQAVDTEFDNQTLRRSLFGLLGEAGQTELMRPHYEAIIRNRQFDIPVLIACTDTSQRLFPAQTIATFIKRNPSDHRLRLGIAQSLRDDRRFADATVVLREIVRHHSDFAPAHALLGRMLTAKQATREEYAEWLTSALPHCRDQANFWIAVGDRNFQSNDFAAALSCYVTAARISPNLVTAWTQISRSIRQVHSESDQQTGLTKEVTESMIKLCDRRSQCLLDLRMHMQRFGGTDERSQHVAADIARTLNSLGRYWEAEAWSAVATTLPDDNDPQLGELRRTIIVNLQQNQDWMSLPDLSPLATYAGLAFAGINRSVSLEATANRITLQGNANALQLADETESRNLVAATVQYRDISSGLIYSMGTGGGTLDFDLDGWADLILPSSGNEMKEQNSTPNSLLRNLDGRFGDVTAKGGCGSTGFGQGIAIGDYNEDGFPDIFFANVGANCLLRNNGDGTFSDDTGSLGTSAHQWTTCGAFVDMDRDGIVDLIAVNYCDLASGVDTPCRTNAGPAPCHPARFPADHDQVLMSDSRGGFRESFVDDLRQVSPGRGLGILAGGLTTASQSAFIANDMSANHLLQVTGKGIAEIAVPSGVAVDGQSLAQASMGIACGDFDGDQDLDLYVTGFAREYNIYYEQSSTGLWSDSTTGQGLVDPTLMTVGFGAQAIDLDADGIDELAVTNGHIGEFGPDQPPLAQPFQLMRRLESGTFESVNLMKQGRYLSTNHTGRALWKIDVDRDLADDLIVTHQNAPPTLLANRTENDNRRIGIQCIGTASSRDAIGAVVRFVASGRQRVIWLLSGDGYMCSNERILKAGIGASDRVEDVTVSWPSGTHESFGTLSAGGTYLLVEGSGEPFSID